MNYPTFLKKVDTLTRNSSGECLSAFVHEIAKKVSEEKRESFLSVLEGFCLSEEKSGDDSLEAEIDSILDKLGEIDDGERTLESRYNCEWESWNDSTWNEQYFFSDPECVLDDVNRAVMLLHESIDREEYEKGYALALKLSELNVPVAGDYDEAAMDLESLIAYELVDGNLDIILKEAVYLAYKGNGCEHRAEAMLGVMDNMHNHSVRLKDIIETEDWKNDCASFLPSWIEALAVRTCYGIDGLLEEALSMLDDDSLVLGFASRYASTHPFIYLYIMRHGLVSPDASKMLEVGLRALDEVGEECRSRKEISLLTAEYALKTGRRDIAEKCWMEAFRTSPDVVNYLRLRLLSEDWRKISGEVEKIYTVCKLENMREQGNLAAFMFFDGRFDEEMDLLIKSDDSSLWTFIALFLLLLSNGASGEGIDAISKKVVRSFSFRSSDFLMGTGFSEEESDSVFFRRCFDKWKADVSLDDAVCAAWMEKIGRSIGKRVEEAMKNDARAMYGDCAAFIAAFGEVGESRGKTGAKQSVFSTYKSLYSRRRLFVAELVNYGFIK